MEDKIIRTKVMAIVRLFLWRADRRGLEGSDKVFRWIFGSVWEERRGIY